MNSCFLLHNAARQYCISHAAAWRERCVSDADKASIFPRYQILDAILNEIERFVDSDFADEQTAREVIEAAGDTACSAFTQYSEPKAITSARDEREKFKRFIRSVSIGECSTCKAMPFRRVLGDAEHMAWHKTFEERWGKWYGGYVDPQKINSKMKSEYVTLHVAAMEHPGAYDSLRSVLARKAIGHVFVLREWGCGYEIALEWANFAYNGAEGFWCDKDLAWMVQASHEASVTFGGDWLVKEMRTALPEFDRFIYKGWDAKLY